jgi:peptide/nickel transport system permease protein
VAPAIGQPRGPGVDRVLRGGRVAAGLALRLLAVLAIGFVLFRLLPGDPVAALTRGRPTTPEQRAALRAQFGLDRPLPVQFADYVGDVLRGDLGTSFVTRRPVVDVVAERLWPTVLLVGLGTALAVLLGGYTGAVAGWRAGSRFDRSVTAVALALWATPAFWLGLLLLVVLGAGAGPLPARSCPSSTRWSGTIAAGRPARGTWVWRSRTAGSRRRRPASDWRHRAPCR